jgi:hypothetical protein
VIKTNYSANPCFTLSECGKVCPGSEKLFQWVSGVLAYIDKHRDDVIPIKV